MRNRATGSAARTSMVRWLGGLLVAMLALMGGQCRSFGHDDAAFAEQ